MFTFEIYTATPVFLWLEWFSTGFEPELILWGMAIECNLTWVSHASTVMTPDSGKLVSIMEPWCIHVLPRLCWL